MPDERLLLTVAETFEIEGRGLVLAPFLPHGEARPKPFAVEVRRPDGTSVLGTALAQIPFVSPSPAKIEAHLLLVDLKKKDVPLGSQLWIT